MNSMRILGAVCAGILASSIGALAACGGTPDAKEPTTAQAVSAASVSIALFDANGVRVGEGSGVMIAPQLVLTSGHLISGKGKWVVTSADGKQKVTGSRGMTYDWMKYDSNKAHPRRHDIGVIHLDQPIKLAAYPRLVGSATADGTKATRIRGTGASFEELDVSLAKYRSSPNAWLTESKPGETLDTGGAVYDSRGILGIVSGRGMTTGKLYVARVDGLMKWLAPKVACAGGALVTRTYAAPGTDKSKEICEDAGPGSSSGSGSNGSSGSGSNGSSGGGSSGSSGGGSSGGGSSGSSGGSDGSSGTCDGNTDGICSGSCGPGTSGPGGDGTPGSNGSNGGSGGSDGTIGSSGGTSGSSGSSGSSVPGGHGTPGGSVPGGDATPGSSSGSSGSSGSAATTPGAGPGDGAGDGKEVCQGPNDNPDICPPEPAGCSGSNCGGGEPDDSIDYGNCACGSTSSDGEIYLR